MKARTTGGSASSIAHYLEIAPRYVRSFEIERDFADPVATKGYVLTPAVLFATQTLSGGLRQDSTQRAWRVTGPYGAGKSAFGLFLSHLAGRTAPGRKLLAQLNEEAPEIHAAWQSVPRYLPIAITGSRAPFGQALIVRLRKAMESNDVRRAPKLLNELKRLERRALSAHIDDEQVRDALARFVDYTVSSSQDEYQGVLLLIDEMGKFLEHAALRPEQADAHVFQRISEMAAGGSKRPLAIVAFLHQNFADYAAGYGERAQEEWSKVAQRFEDIPFDESLEQYGFLLGKAMQYKGNVLKESGVEVRARESYSRTVTSGRSGRPSAFLETSPNLYPIHPATFLGLTTAVKRFGQNQRSLFSFLLSREANGLQQFVRETELHVENWYRLPRLFDYLASLDGVSFRQGDRARKWDLLRETLAHGPELGALESDILKAVGLLNVLEPVPYILPDKKTLSRALTDKDDSEDVRQALDALVDKGVLYFRRATGDYCLWRHSSVDLQALYEEAARSTRVMTTFDDLMVAIGQGRSIIAHRHYQRTGTLRAFRFRYVSLAQLLGAHFDDAIEDYDGEVLVILLEPGQSLKASAELSRHPFAVNPRRLIVVRKIEQLDLAVAKEIRTYDRIRQTCVELRVDEFARREVDQSLDRVKRQLEERLANVASFGQTEYPADIQWLYLGKIVKVQSRRDLSVLLSNICDSVYAKSPIVQNELINRHKLSSAISLARQKLIGAMLTNGDDLGLGFTGMPPERAIYLSLFRETGLHRNANGVIGFHLPRADADKCRWGPVWQGLREFLAAKGNVTFENVLAFLRQPPYGLRDGPALLLIVAFVLSERRNIALFERNTYLVTFTEDHIQRLVKSARNFSLHLKPPASGTQRLFLAYAAALKVIHDKDDILTDTHGVVSCLYRWYARLSEYALQTQRVSETAREIRTILKRAMDPVVLLTKSLPAACNHQDLDTAKKKELDHFAETLHVALFEINEVDNTLRQRVLFLLNDAFGAQGSVQELREFLRKNFGPYEADLGDYKIKAALSRALDRGLADLAWVDSMAALLAERSIALWKDETLDIFQAAAIEFAGKLNRWVGLMVQLKSKPSGAASLVSVYVTGRSGAERSWVVTDPPQARASSVELKKALQRVIAMNPGEAPLALAQALAEILSEPAIKEATKRGNNP